MLWISRASAPAAAAASTRRPTWGRSASRGTAGVATYTRFPAE